MKILLIVLLSAFIGCQTYNANTFDKDNYGNSDLIGGPNFKASYKILQNKCMNCHTHAQWSEYTHKDDWTVHGGRVINGDPDNSPLINRIINYGGSSSDMPQGGQALTSDEFQKLVDWVKDIDS